MKFLQRTLFVSIFLSVGAANAANPIASWDFDDGKNINYEVGTTEFERSQRTNFSGLKSKGSQVINLSANTKVDPSRFFVDSLRKKALRTGVDETNDKVFSAHGRFVKPLSRKNGTVAMWVKAENWNGNQKGKFRIFFAANDNKKVRTNELLIYKNGKNNNILFLIGDNNPKKWTGIGKSIWNWKAGEWHFIAATWSPQTVVLYVDGQATELPRKQPISQFDYELFHIGTRRWKNEGGLTQIDDLMIFDKTLTKSELDGVYVKTKPLANDRKAPLEYKLGIQTPVLDGKINAFEYGMISNATFNIKSMEVTKDSRWAVARDDKNLYFACDTIAPVNKAKIKKRDGYLWEDESIEIHLENGNKQWQFIVNSAGYLYDSLNNKISWNIKELHQKHAIVNGRWIFEAAIPFKALGLEPQENERFYFTLTRSSGLISVYTAASPLLRRFSDKSNFVKVIFDKSAVPAEIYFKDFAGRKGTLSIEAGLPSGNKGIFHLKGSDTRGRLLAESKSAFQNKNGKASALLNAKGLAMNGRLNYTVQANGNEIFKGNFSYVTPEKLKSRYIRVHIKEQKLECALQLSPPINPELIIIQELKDKKGKTVLSKQDKIGKENSEKFNAVYFWDLKQLPPGDYDYYLYSVDKGKKEQLHHQYFLKPAAKMPWTDFTAGIDKENVPAPWKTPTAEKSVLKCTYHEYDFNGTLLPRQIRAKGIDILAAPIQLRINGKAVTVPAELQILEKNPQSVKFRTVGSYDKYNFTVNGYVEYDGFLNLSLTYSAKNAGNSELKDLTLEIPMKEEYSKLFFNYRPSDVRASGRLTKVFSKDLMTHPVFWIGDADYGLFWGTDSMRGSRIRNTNNSLVITPAANGKGAVSKIKIVDTPFQMRSNKRTFEFILQATPVKEPGKKFNHPWMFRGGETITSTHFHQIFNYYNPKYMDCKRLKSQVKSARFPIYAFYSCIYGVSPFCPEWPWYQEKWISSPPGPGIYKQDWPLHNEKARNRGYWAFGCVNEPEFMNWQLYWLYLLITNKEYGVKDLYFDMAYPRSCDNMIHGCGWKDDFGLIRMTYPIKANREFTKRIRKIMYDKDPSGCLLYHPSGEPIPPMYGHVDFVYDGEVFVFQIAEEESYYKIFNPALIQSAFTGIQSGVKAAYISQLNRSAMMFNPARSAYWRQKVLAPKAMQAVRHFLGFILTHNLRPAAGVAIYQEGDKIQKLLGTLGYTTGDVQFIPYWRKNCPVKTNAPVLLSVYSFKGKMLAVIMNNNDKDINVTMNRPAGYNGRIYDLENNSVINKLSVNVKKRDFRMIVFEEK